MRLGAVLSFCRVLMRREQIFKICLNHVLTADVKYMPKDAKTWLFSAPDYSEGELTNEQFCVRFKNAEIAQEFLKAVNDALGGASSDTGKEPSTGFSNNVNSTMIISFASVTIFLMATYYLYSRRSNY